MVARVRCEGRFRRVVPNRATRVWIRTDAELLRGSRVLPSNRWRCRARLDRIAFWWRNIQGLGGAHGGRGLVGLRTHPWVISALADTVASPSARVPLWLDWCANEVGTGARIQSAPCRSSGLGPAATVVCDGGEQE